MKLKNTTDKPAFIKLCTFIMIFLLSVKLKEYMLPVEKTVNRFGLFRHEQKMTASFLSQISNLKEQFFFKSTKEFLVLLFRIVLSSFVKDMLISAMSPSIFRSPVSNNLIHRVEKETLDKSWIPVLKHSKTGVEKVKENENAEYKAVDQFGHTFVYRFGHKSVDASLKLTHNLTIFATQVVEMIISLFNKFCSQAFSMFIFAIRSSACTFSSVVLLVFYIVQLFLRILKIMYAAAEWTLMYACSMVNDVSLLALEIIHKTSVRSGEDIYVKLKKSVNRVNEPIKLKESKVKLTKSHTSDSSFATSLKFW